MINILIVDDMPEIKIANAIEYLKSQNLDFNYEIIKNVRSALLYLHQHSNEIDLAIVDLGLPFYADSSDYGELEGLTIVDEILRLELSIPVIINSTTKIPNEEQYQKDFENINSTIEHVEELYGSWLHDFIQKISTK